MKKWTKTQKQGKIYLAPIILKDLTRFLYSPSSQLYMKKFLIFILVTLLTIQLVSAATLTGTIYDYQLNELNDVLIEISGDTTQKLLADSSDYEFNLAQGGYTLKARWADLEAVEIITINEDDLTYDLFLFPSFADEDDLWDDLDLEVDINTESTNSSNADIIILLVFILIGIFVLIKTKVFKSDKPSKKAKEKKSKKVASVESKISVTKEEKKESLPQTKEDSDDQLAQRVLTFLKDNEGRVSQKQLRKELIDVSEAKVSLVLTELVHKNKIEKIKKGRGNVIILK